MGNMNLIVTLTLSDRLFELLENKLPDIGNRVYRAVTKEIKAQVGAEMGVTVSAAPVDEAQDTATVAPAATAHVETPDTTASDRETPVEATEAPVEAAAPSDGQTAVPTLEECRDAARRAHARIIGEDYESQADTDRYKKYHRRIVELARQITMQLTGGKESKFIKLPEDKRADYIAEMDALRLDENNVIVSQSAPF